MAEIQITNAHKGKRFIIGGYSPFLKELPREFLETGVVIGVNKFAAEFPCDYFIGLDTGLNWEKFVMSDRYPDEPKFLESLACPKFMRLPNEDTETYVPQDAGIFFDQAPQNIIPTEWNGTLAWISSTALAAINLAIIMGASEIYLYAVDFVGQGRADGTEYPKPEKGPFWDNHKEGINNYIRWFSQHTKIYKTHPDSWLDCEFKDIREYKKEEETMAEEKLQTSAFPSDDEIQKTPPKAIKAKSFEDGLDDVAKKERDKYRSIWEFPAYREHSPGLRNLSKFFMQIQPEVNSVVADFGCGSGKIAEPLRNNGLKVVLVDIADNCLDEKAKEQLLPGWCDFVEGNLWDLPKLPTYPNNVNAGKVDHFYCCDVMEHIPPEKVDAVLAEIAKVTIKSGYFSISCLPEHFGKLINDHLHLTVQNADWWIQKLGEHFQVFPHEMNESWVSATVLPKTKE